MTYAQNLSIFFILLLGIIIVPGMDMFFVVANGLTGGRAMAAPADVMLGGVFHNLFAMICEGVLTTLPGFVFTAILLAGAAYMGWIGGHGGRGVWRWRRQRCGGWPAVDH